MIMNDSQNCAKVLFSLDLPEGEIEDAEKLWNSSAELREALCSKAVTVQEKYAVCDKLFSGELSAFMKVMCEFGHISKLGSIFEAYRAEKLRSEDALSAELYYVNMPDEEMIESIKTTLKKKYGVSRVELKAESDESLFGGYLLCVGDTEYDKSISGAVKALHKKLIRR